MTVPARDSEATLVLIHPIGNDIGSWDFVGLDHAKRFEFPGHGERPRQSDFTQADLADMVASEFEGPLDIVGMSMGGAVVANLLVRHPERIRSAVVICSGSIAVANLTPQMLEKRIETMRARADLSKNGMEGVLADTMPRWFTPWALRTDQPGVRYARETLLKMDPKAWYDVWNCQGISEALTIDAIKAIEQPVTIVGGINDFASGLRGLTDLHEMVQDSRFEIMPISHMAHLEHPEFVRAAIDRHFAWAPIGQRVEAPMGSSVWLTVEDNWIADHTNQRSESK
ncbi:MAG TPA: alpha/beta fold hydrolase [Galbitalea sp.]|jgi:pimeloyl-ACP methyl ester carboxylesterase